MTQNYTEERKQSTRFVTERTEKGKGVPLVNLVHITQILWDENHRQLI